MKPARCAMRSKRFLGIVFFVGLLLLLGGVVGWLWVLRISRKDSFDWDPHPRLKASFRERLGSDQEAEGRQEELERLLLEADRLLSHPVHIPEEGGQWIFYYACPFHNCSLERDEQGRHRCPRCGKIFDDERTRLAFASLEHNRINEAALTLAQAWKETGKEAYAREVYRILGRYADLHPTWKRHDRWGRWGVLAVIGGKRYCQSLSDAVGIIKMAKAYDWVYDWSGAEESAKERIEKDFFLATIDSIYAFYPLYSPTNNHMTWFNAAGAVVGAVLGREEYLNRAINGSKGLRFQWEESVTQDGLWYEGTLSYHFYALEAVMETVCAAKAAGLDLTGEEALKSMLLGPLQLAYPNGQLPAMNDGDRTFLSRYRDRYVYAASLFDDPAIDTFARTGKIPSLGSELLEESGLAVLRRGEGEEAVMAVFDFGEHGGHHGHPDKLNLMLYTLGREVFLDPGRLSYRCPEHKSWSRQTVAHNTVVIDQKSQPGVAGRCLDFGRGSWCDHVAGEFSAYRGVQIRRGLVLCDDCLVDCIEIEAKRDRTIDWVVHGLADLQIPPGLRSRNDPIHHGAGYPHLTDLLEGEAPQTSEWDWGLEDGRFVRTSVHLDWVPADVLVFSGNGIGYELTDKVPFLMFRWRGNRGTLVALHDLSGTGNALTGTTLSDWKDGGKISFLSGGRPREISWEADMSQWTLKGENG